MRTLFVAAAVSFVVVSTAGAAIVPYTEHFNADAANWYNATSTATVDWESTGGPDGSGHVSTTYDPSGAVEGNTPVLFRAQDEFGSSGNAFVGDYIAEGVTQFSAWVRHDASVPLNFFVRFSTPISFPGAVAVDFTPVQPNQWTLISFSIDAANPQFVSFEGSNFNAVFSNVGHIQAGPSIPAELAGTTDLVTIDFDEVSITPEPASALYVGAIAIAAGVRRRRRGA